MAGGKVPVLVGPTAVGKTAVALALSAHWPLEIISADSRQVYRRLDIGTAKPTRKERARAPHHGIDLIDPGCRYSAGHFARDAVGWLADIRGRDKLPLIVGGTGLYVRALAEGLFSEPPLDPARR
ncbi:MAG TPA: isopentenyl transferase family protein, partial [Gemmatimonadales bacterium]